MGHMPTVTYGSWDSSKGAGRSSSVGEERFITLRVVGNGVHVGKVSRKPATGRTIRAAHSANKN